MITQLELKEILHYNPDTGVFTWLINKAKKIKAGAVAGCLMQSGYFRIKINYKTYFAHRLAMLYMTGKMPDYDTDHVNGIKNDNRFINLREATRSENMRNKVIYKTNSSGYKGVDFHKRTQKFRARVIIGKNRVYLGLFKTAKEASKVYQKHAKKSFGEFYCNGER